MNKYVKGALIKAIDSIEDGHGKPMIDFALENISWEEMSGEELIDWCLNELVVCTSCGEAKYADQATRFSDDEVYCVECRKAGR